MKRKIILLAIIILGGSANAQDFEKIDDYSAVFIYDYQFYDTHKDPKSLKRFEMVLEIGSKYSRFYGVHHQIRDSLTMLYKNEPAEVAFSSTMSKIRGLPAHPYCSFYIYKDYPKAGFTLFTASDMGVFNFYSVTEEPDFAWKIEGNIKETILGYTCTKATCTYAGRDYEAWFTTEIPLNDGPYKFRGLPGLIVKIEDKDKEHVFSLQEIKKSESKPLYYRRNNKSITTDAKGYVKALEASKAKFVELLDGLGYSDDNRRIRAVTRAQKRDNFIERY